MSSTLTGFSTGALAGSDLQKALAMIYHTEARVVELSALRDHELMPLLGIIDDMDLSQFDYVSIHAPSKYVLLTEYEVAESMLPVCIKYNYPLIVHPDTLTSPDLWLPFGELLCIENMDKRKGCGRTYAELQTIFDVYNSASFCLDLGHVRQLDATMSEAVVLLHKIGDRLKQLHVSEVDTQCKHHKLSESSIRAYASIASLIPDAIPIVLETPVQSDEMAAEVIKIDSVLRSMSLPVV